MQTLIQGACGGAGEGGWRAGAEVLHFWRDPE